MESFEPPPASSRTEVDISWNMQTSEIENMDRVPDLLFTGEQLHRQAAQECLPSGLGMGILRIGINERNQERYRECNCKAEKKLQELKKNRVLLCKEQTEAKKALEEVKKENELKSRECTEARALLKELQDEFMRKSMHVDSLAFAVEGLVNDKRKWCSALQELAEKLLVLKSSHLKISDEAMDFEKCVQDFSNMMPRVQFALSQNLDLEKQHEDLKLKYIEVEKEQKELNNEVLLLKGETLRSLNFASRVRGLELGAAEKQVDVSEFLKYKQMFEKANQDAENKDEQIRKMEEAINSLKLKVKSKDASKSALQDQVKDLESQLLVERRHTRQHVDAKIVDQQLQEYHPTMITQQVIGSKPVVGQPSLKDQIDAIHPLTLFNSNDSKVLPPIPGSLLKYKFLQKENIPDGAEPPVLRRTARTSICRTTQGIPVTQVAPHCNSLIPFPTSSTTRTAQDRVKGLESQLLVERWLAKQQVDTKIVEQQLEEDHPTLKPRQGSGSNQVVGQPSLREQINALRPLSFNCNKAQVLPPVPGSLLKYKCLQKENKPYGAEPSLLRTTRASICTTTQRIPVTQVAQRRNLLISVPTPSTMRTTHVKRITGIPLPRALPILKKDINAGENISEIGPRNFKIGSRSPNINNRLRGSIKKKVYIRSPLSLQSSRRVGGVDKVRYSIGTQSRMAHRVLANNSKALKEKQPQKEKER